MDVENSSLQLDLTTQVSWLGLRVGSCLALFYIHQMNRVKSLNDFVTMTLNIVWIIIIIIIIIIVICVPEYI